MLKIMKILSLFDGISCARVALERTGIPVDAYYASEVDKYAIQISSKNYPDIKQLGDVTGVAIDLDRTQGDDLAIDLLIGGSPCQDLSIAKKNRKGLDGERSGLFWEYVRILKEVKPKYFILENVASMSKESKDIISEALGVQPIMINASLVSAQNRKRLFWTNIPGVTLPEDRGILLQDILENGTVDRFKAYCIDANYWKGASWKSYKEKSRRQLVKLGDIFPSGSQAGRVFSPKGKSVALSALGGGAGGKTGLYMTKHTHETGAELEAIRKLTPIECERLQGLPDNYTEGVSNTQRYKCLGNAFNVDVVAHILSFIK
jgi:DNA-cytosine methyltransferase